MAKKKIARPSVRKVRLLRDWLKELNRWRIPNTFMNNCLFVDAEKEDEKMYVRGAYDAIQNTLSLFSEKQR